jgi:hypothetical protein
MYTDLKQFDKLVTEVFDTKMRIDYSVLLGIEPYDTTGEAQAKKLQEQTAHMDSTQHIVTSV